MLGLLGGFAIVLYFILNALVSCCVEKKFANYLASQLFTIQTVQLEDYSEAGCCKSVLKDTHQLGESADSCNNAVFA